MILFEEFIAGERDVRARARPHDARQHLPVHFAKQAQAVQVSRALQADSKAFVLRPIGVLGEIFAEIEILLFEL